MEIFLALFRILNIVILCRNKKMAENKSFAAVTATKKNLNTRKDEMSKEMVENSKELVMALEEHMTVKIPDQDYEEIDARSVLIRMCE